MSLVNKIRTRLAQYPFAKQVIKFGIVGGTSAIIHFSILFVFTEIFQVWYIFSNGLGFIISATFNFTANKFWTFRNIERGREIFKQIVKFSMVLLVGLIINTSIIYMVTEWAGLDYRLSWLFAAGIVTFWNFGFNRFWTFRARQEQLADLPKNE